MSWITPIKNTFIKFIVKGKTGGGGIDEDTLNSKLAQFYATTETKILNLVNQQLANYVLATDFQALQEKVTTNTNNIVELTNKVNNLPNSSNGSKMSMLIADVTFDLTTPSISTNPIKMGTTFIPNPVTNISLSNGQTISLNELKKYLVSEQYFYQVLPNNLSVIWVHFTDMGQTQIGDDVSGLLVSAVAIPRDGATQVPIPSNSQINVNIHLALSDTMENILSKISSLTAIESNNIAKVKQWIDLGGDNS